MNLDDIERKQLILIDFLSNTIKDNTWKIKAEYQTSDNDSKVIVVQEQTGSKVVFYDSDTTPLYNYYSINVYGESVREEKNMSLKLGYLIGTNNIIEVKNGNDTEKWQVLIKQFSNFQPIEYLDIRRIGYNATMQCIINKIN